MPYIPEYEEEQHYDGKITGAEFGESGTKLTFNIAVKGEHGVVFKRMFITPAAWEYNEKTLKDIGITDEHLDQVENLEQLGKFIEGNDVSFTIEHTEYQGKNHTQIKWLNAPRQMRPKKANPMTKAAAVAALMAIRKGMPMPARGDGLVSGPRSAPEPFAPTQEDEDVPF